MKQPRKKTWKKPQAFRKRCGKIAGILGCFHDGPTRKHMMIVELDGVKALLKDDFKFEVDQIVDQT